MAKPVLPVRTLSQSYYPAEEYRQSGRGILEFNTRKAGKYIPLENYKYQETDGKKYFGRKSNSTSKITFL